MSDNENKLIGPHMSSEWSQTRLSKLNIFEDLCSKNNIWVHVLSLNDATFDNELDYYSKFYDPCDVALVNHDINGPQKEIGS